MGIGPSAATRVLLLTPVLDMLTYEAGAFYVIYRGWLDFTRWHLLHQSGVFFVTHAKWGMTRVAST